MSQVDTQPSTLAEPVAPTLGQQIQYGERIYNEVMHFLIEEAHLLDAGLFMEWLNLLSDDIRVTMPVRQSYERKRGDGRTAMMWLYEDKDMLTFKAKRLYTGSAFAEDPPSRVRRMVTNLRLHETAVQGEYLAQSHLLLQRNRGDEHQFVSFSARRDDVLRRSAQGWQIAKREILVDQAVLGMANLAVFI